MILSFEISPVGFPSSDGTLAAARGLRSRIGFIQKLPATYFSVAPFIDAFLPPLLPSARRVASTTYVHASLITPGRRGRARRTCRTLKKQGSKSETNDISIFRANMFDVCSSCLHFFFHHVIVAFISLFLSLPPFLPFFYLASQFCKLLRFMKNIDLS